MTKYERFSYVGTEEQAQDITESLKKLGFKAYYKFTWVVMREVKE
jgi:hypothetical protein